MNPNDNIIKTLDYLAQKIGIAIDWSAQNVLPAVGELCSRYIKYEIVVSSCNLIIWSLMAGICIYIVYRCGKKIFKEYKECDDIGDVVASIIFGSTAVVILSTLAGLFISDHILPELHDIITCLTFPELQIYEKLAELKNSIPS